jgi:predicted Na+-dependent transporter
MGLAHKVKTYFEDRFGLLLLLSCAAGLVVPGLDLLPNSTAVAVLAALMFTSCYRLREGGLWDIRWSEVLVFYLLRYVLLPVILWGVASLLVPSYAIGVFLLSVLPAAVSSPAIAHIYGSRGATGFAIVILSQLLTPLLIPLQFAWLGAWDAAAAVQVVPSPGALFVTMVWCIFVPMLLYRLVRNHQPLTDVMLVQNKIMSMALVAFVIALIIAKQRHIILTQVDALAASLAITLVCFCIYIAFGWWVARRRERSERVTYAVCSCFNNAALGVSLALLHFPPDIILFVAVSEIAWSMLPFLLGLFLNRV